MHNGPRSSGTVAAGCATATQAGLPVPLCAPVAQLDRALAYEARGRVFESPRAYHNSFRTRNLQKPIKREPAFDVPKNI